jgi:peptide/nickel transport system substrate-binding protein
MPDTLVYKIIDNNTTAANLLLTGELNFGVVEGADIQRLRGSSSLSRQIVRNQLVSSLFLNQRSGRVFADPGGAKLREAVFNAVDRGKVNQSWLDGTGTITPSVIRPEAECFDPKTKTMVPATGSIDRAKQILTAAGYSWVNGKLTKGGDRVPRIRLLMTTQMNAAPEYVNAVLNDLGFDVEFSNLDATAYGAAFVQGNFDVTMVRGTRLAPEAGEQLSVYTGEPSPVGTNYSAIGVQDPEFQRLVKAGYQNPGHGGCKYFALVQERMLKNFWVLPLVGQNNEYYGTKGYFFPNASVDAGGAFPVYFIKVSK